MLLGCWPASRVALFTEARIETGSGCEHSRNGPRRSLHGGADRNGCNAAGPVQCPVALFTEARIETCPGAGKRRSERVALFTEARIETCPRSSAQGRRGVALFTEARIETCTSW